MDLLPQQPLTSNFCQQQPKNLLSIKFTLHSHLTATSPIYPAKYLATYQTVQVVQCLTSPTYIKSRWAPSRGTIDAHCPCEFRGEHIYKVIYDDGDVREENLASCQFNIINVSSAENKQAIDPPDGFLVNDNDHEILFPETNEWTSFRAAQARLTFYNYSYPDKTCDVEWNGNGRVFHTKFRVADSKR